MTDDFKHAKITGQDMRDHWGPIVDRIADEIEASQDPRIKELEAEVERLRNDHASAVAELNKAKALLKGYRRGFKKARAQ